MTIDLPDLGNNFTIRPINDGNSFTPVVSEQSFHISPGTYLVSRAGVATTKDANASWKNIVLKEFSAPKANLESIHVVHAPTADWTEGTPYTVNATIACKTEPETVEVAVVAGFRPKVFTMKKIGGYRYSVTIPGGELKEGFLRYFIAVKEKGGEISYPGGEKLSPSESDFDNRNPFEVRVLPAASPVYIFDAMNDNDKLSRPWNRESSFVPKATPGDAEIRVIIQKLFTIDPENTNAPPIHDFVSVGLREDDYRISLAELKKVKLVTLPRPYPTFLPYFFEDGVSKKMDIAEVESLQISIGPGIPDSELSTSHALALESVRLE
jgi:hypothetical protein